MPINTQRVSTGILVGLLGAAAFGCSSTDGGQVAADAQDQTPEGQGGEPAAVDGDEATPTEAGAAGASDKTDETSEAGAGVGTEGGASGVTARGEGGWAKVGGAGGAGGVGGAPSEPACTKASDCDDGKSCNGPETCVDGACVAGEATKCAAGMQCSDDDAGTCIFADKSPWIVYQADDDTPGVSEVYVVKRGLLGQMDPIKINDQLVAGWGAAWGGEWSPDHQLYSFHVRRMSPYQTALELVHFGKLGPETAVRVEGEELLWSPSGKAFVVEEEQGLSIYDYADDGTFQRNFHTTNADAAHVHGWWTKHDEFVFASKSVASQKSGIHRAARDGSAWKDSSLIESLDMFTFSLSPSGDEIVYETPATNNAESSLFVMQVKQGSKPKLLGPPGWLSPKERVSLDYSSDGARFLLVVTNPDNAVRIYLGNGAAYSATLTQIAPTKLLLGAGFSPDGQKILLREKVNDWGADLGVMTLDDTNYTYDTLTRMGINDQGPLWAPDGDSALTSARDDDGADLKLRLVSLSGRYSDTVDTISNGSQFAGMWFSAHSEFAAYSKGTPQSYDGAYVDLRYGVGTPKAVRLPGEGSIWSIGFDPDGTGLYYVREKNNGARDCAYIDLSHQVAKDPVKVNRDGRVDYCLAQPLTP